MKPVTQYPRVSGKQGESSVTNDILEETSKLLNETDIKSELSELVFVSNRAGSRLQAKSDEFPAKATKIGSKEFQFEFEKPCFIREIRVEATSEWGRAPKVKLEARLASSNIWTKFATEEGQGPFATSAVGRMANAVRISNARSRMDFDDHLEKVIIDGWNVEDLEAIERAAGRFDEHASQLVHEKNRIQNLRSALATEAEGIKKLKTSAQDVVSELQAQQAAIETTISEKQSVLDALEIEIESRSAQLAAIATESVGRVAELERHDASLQTAESRLAQIQSDILVRQRVASELRDEIARLGSDKSIFAEDMAGFTKQGSSQVSTYLVLLVIALGVASSLAAVSMYGAISTFDTYVSNPNLYEQAGNLILLKIPFVVIASAVYAFLYKISRPLVLRIIEIHSIELRVSEAIEWC